MSGGGGGGGVRDSIPGSVKKTIQDIKEITGNHSEDEIYAMLKECSMDPNETVQRLLIQDPFHEVRRKKGRRKENTNNKESTESRWRPGTQGRGNKGNRDASGAKYSGSGRDSGPKQATEKGAGPPLLMPQNTKSKEFAPVSSSSTILTNGPATVASGNTTCVNASYISAKTAPDQPVGISSSVDVKSATKPLGTEDTCTELKPSSSNCSVPVNPASSTVYFSASDPVLRPSTDSRLPGAIGTIRREVGLTRTPTEQNVIPPAENIFPTKSHGVGKNQPTETLNLSSASVHNSTSTSRPSSSYGSRSLQIIGPQKVGSNKEWKPKPTNPNAGQGSIISSGSEVLSTSVEVSGQSQSVSNVLESDEATSKLQKKLEELNLPQRKHVIIPNHIHVPESERTKLSFGSFDATFGVSSSYASPPESEKSSTPESETSQGVEEAVSYSNQIEVATTEEGDPELPQSSSRAPENLSAEGDISNTNVTEYNESKQENALLPGGHSYSVVNNSPNYSFGFAPPVLGSQLAPFENSDSQARDVSRLPSFVVQQPFDPANYYAQFYRSGADSDGRISPFTSPGVATKYNGNVAVLPTATSSQSGQEGGNSLVLSTPGQTQLATPAAGPMQSNIAATQQPIPVFRPPAGMHISHYPPNYIPYGHYFSPFYVPPPAVHQFLSNGAFPQQPQPSSVYPAPPPPASAGVKYTLPQQYKPGGNTGNSTHMGMPSAYGPYGPSSAGYNPSSTASTGNATGNEDLGVSHFKENNVYLAGQQSEGSTVWIAAPGREMSSMPGSSFYNLHPQGQHVTFAATQPGHGSFAGIYHHPAQAVTAASVHPHLQQSQQQQPMAGAGGVDMIGPGGNVYQTPQHAQMNWPSNY